MAVFSFSDVYEALDERVSGKSYLYGEEIATEDAKVYFLLSEKPSSESYPNASRWYDAVRKKLVSSYLENAGWVSNAGQEASADDANKESTAKEDDVVVEEAEEEKKIAHKRKRAEDEEEEKESSTKKKESEKTWTSSRTVTYQGDPWAERIRENAANLSSHVEFVSSAECTVEATSDREKWMRITFKIKSDFISEDARFDDGFQEMFRRLIDGYVFGHDDELVF